MLILELGEDPLEVEHGLPIPFLQVESQRHDLANVFLHELIVFGEVVVQGILVAKHIVVLVVIMD